MKIANHSLPIWILENQIKTERGVPFEFRDHLFLFDFLRDTSPEIAGKKAGQMGWSVGANLKAFHEADKFRHSTIYTMPSDSDVEEFSKTKTDPIFQNNDVIRRKLKLNNVGLKQVGDTFLYFKGTRSKAAPISTSTDILIHDELDRSDLNIIEIYRSRITASDYRRVWQFSNPSIKNVGIDLAWKESDKKEWFIICPECTEKQMLVWSENVDEIKGVYVCSSCNAPLPDNARRLGKWDPTGLGKVSGYHVSQMMAPWLSAADLIVQREKRGIEYFLNFVLGEPYTVGEETNFRQMMLDSWTSDPIDQEPLFMGIDVGKIKHWVLGSNKGIFKIGKCESREELEDVIRRYNPTTVMDSGPERTWAEEFKKKFPKLYLCFYLKGDDPIKKIVWGGEKDSKDEFKKMGYVWIDKHRVIDDLVYDMMNGEFLFSLTRENLEAYTAHWETMRRIITEVGSDKRKRYIWETTTGVNHWASATWFWYLARIKGQALKVEMLSELEVKKDVVERTATGFRMRDLKEIIESGQQEE